MTSINVSLCLARPASGPVEGQFILTAAQATPGHWLPQGRGYYPGLYGSISREPFGFTTILDFTSSTNDGVGGIAFTGNQHLAALQNKKLYIDGVEYSRTWEIDGAATFMWWPSGVPFGFNVGQQYNIEIK